MPYSHGSQRSHEESSPQERAVERVWMEALEGRVLLSGEQSSAVLLDFRGYGETGRGFFAQEGSEYLIIEWGEAQVSVVPYGVVRPQVWKLSAQGSVNRLQW